MTGKKNVFLPPLPLPALTHTHTHTHTSSWPQETYGCCIRRSCRLVATRSIALAARMQDMCCCESIPAIKKKNRLFVGVCGKAEFAAHFD